MNKKINPFGTLRPFSCDAGDGYFYSLPVLEEAGFPNLSRLPASIRIVLESLLRNCDGKKVTEADVRNLANWNAASPGDYEIPFTVARVVLQDFTGVPLLVDLAAMRSAVSKLGKNPKIIEPLVPVDLVVDHSVQVDFAGTSDAFQQNLELEFYRNHERYQFLKWGVQAFDTFKVVPPGIGIVHQVNLEYLAKGVFEKDGVFYPDSLVGTDSHTTMINGLGIVGWGVGGIEAEAAMLGQPVTFLVPEVVGVYLEGTLREGVTATDLALTVTEMLRKAKVVGKFVEFYGPGAAALPVVDRATIANMAPEYGATMGFFPIDAECVTYLRATGRDEKQIARYEAYYKAQKLWGMPQKGDVDYSVDLSLDLTAVMPSVAGPKRPQDRIDLPNLGREFDAAFSRAISENGFGKNVADLGEKFHVTCAVDSCQFSNPSGGSQEPVSALDSREKNTNVMTEHEMANNRPTPGKNNDCAPSLEGDIGHGSVLIAAITSCTNTSNPSVMLAAGLLAKKAVERGLTVPATVKASLAPGSRVVTDYLEQTGLAPYLDKLGFQTVGYGCTTCIGNSGPLHPAIEDAVVQHDLITASVLSGNRNFEARIHQNIKANFLMSPPLVVAFALAGRVNLDLAREPLGIGSDGRPVFLRDVWPSLREIQEMMATALSPDVFKKRYTNFAAQNPKWNEIQSTAGLVYEWDRHSTYIQEPPFFENYATETAEAAEIQGARPLGIFGDSITTDHISPAGSIKKDSPAGRYLGENGVPFADFNSYGSRRGNDRVMTRGTFANVRIKNQMTPGVEGGVTRCFASDAAGPVMPIYDAAQQYKAAKIPLIVIGGDDYGMGSSRDWAAKGTRLLGVKAVVTKSFERIHRSNLVGMGVLPLTFKNKTDYDKVKNLTDVTFDIMGISGEIKPQQDAVMRVHPAGEAAFDLAVTVRLDTPVEVDYYKAGGILPCVLTQIVKEKSALP